MSDEKKIAFQGELGAYGHQACLTVRPTHTPLPCATFEAVIEAVQSGAAELAVVPVENSTYGRVADIHRLLPASGLHIIGETFVKVEIALLGVPGAKIEDVKEAHGHLVILPQCSDFLDANGITPRISSDNARAARDVAAQGDPGKAALASTLAGEIYGLTPLAQRIENEKNNTTRFLLMAPYADMTRRSERMITTFVFQVRNIPASLYKAMGGFATNGINMTKLESYMVGGQFTATQFYADIEGHPGDQSLKLAFEELDFYTQYLKVLGTYPADPRRDT
ncbi:MAG: prephenate dehydratase [Rhodobacteraceae bacterium]|nr:prephenate dehydratase [Paracoccaceae bacterium]